jgi:Ca2+-transporting ATPase
MEDHNQSYQGLSTDQVKEKQLKYGFNELDESKPKNLLNIILEVLKEPMFILLILCCILYLILGDKDGALILSVFVIVIIGITFFQTWKTETTLSALKELTNPKALVIRDGIESYISSRELVVDDILILNEGDKISADALLLSAINLMADESSLTGESVPVAKHDSGIAYGGTLITQGKAYAKVTAIGNHTELGKIGKSIQTITKEDSRFKKEVGKLVAKMLIIGGVLCLVIIGFWFVRGDLLKGLLTSLTFAIAMLPEEIPAVLTIFMALGAWRISNKKVLTRNMSAIETLGSISVLCTDKTGTITENKMTLSEVFAAGNSYKINKETIPNEFHSLIEFAILASKEHSFDPMEKALVKVVESKLIDSEHLHKDWKLVQEYPLSKELLAMSRAWDLPDTEEFSFYSKGSPEAIFDLCHLNQEETKALTTQVEEMAARGLRVLGVANSRTSLKQLPDKQHEIDFEFSGLIAFADPIREGIKEAVKDCYSAGIKLIMITGDYHVTAQSIAKEIGLKNPENFIIGSELEKLSDDELQKQISKITIFSRVAPQQKLRIVNALKANQEIVAMTGDGVNDAPALKSSHVGIAMGKAGTNVARESADLILLDDNFSSIVSAIALGRRIFDNLRKAMAYIVAVHVPIAGLTLVPVIFADLPVLLFPIHVAFLELVIDPTCSIVFEAESADKNIMTKAPRKMTEAILNTRKLMISVFQGFCVFALVIVVYLLSIKAGKSDGEVRLFSFASLLILNFFLTIINKSIRGKSINELLTENKTLLIVVTVIIIFFTLILNIATLRRLFYFS